MVVPAPIVVACLNLYVVACNPRATLIEGVPLQDLNVMVRRGLARAVVHATTSEAVTTANFCAPLDQTGCPDAPESVDVTILYFAAGACEVVLSDGTAIKVDDGHALRLNWSSAATKAPMARLLKIQASSAAAMVVQCDIDELW